MVREVHKCFLKKDQVLLTLSPLAPNANRCQRFRRWLRKQCLLDLKNKRCQELFNNQSSRKSELRRHVKSPYPYIIHPYSKVNFILELFFFVLWTSEIVFFPLEHSIYLEWHKRNFTTDMVLNGFCLLVICLFFVVGYVDFKRRVVVIEAKRVALHYLRTNFIFDLVAAVGEDLIRFTENLFGYNEAYYSTHIIAFAIIFGAHLTRAPTLLRILKNINMALGMNDGIHFVVFHIFLGMIFLHFLTCLTFGASMKYFFDHYQKYDSFHNQSWLHVAGIDNHAAPRSMIYHKVCLVVTCYFFGAAHGMYSVTLPGEQFVLFLLGIFGRLYTLFIIADLLRFFDLVKVSESRYEQYMVQLDEFMRSKNLPVKMKKKLTRYYEYKFQKEYFDEKEIFDMLSDHLKMELFLFGARKLIDKIAVFRKLPRAVMATLIAQMRAETFLPNDVIIKAGDLICDICFVSCGTVAVMHERNELIHLVDGEVMGLVSMYKYQKKTHEFSYIAVEITEIYSIDKDNFSKFLEHNPEVYSYFQGKADQTAWKYEMVRRKNVFMEGSGVLDAVRSGKLLEKPKLRPSIVES